MKSLCKISLNISTLFLLIWIGAMLSGCGPSSPRFVSHGKSEHKEDRSKKGSIRFSSVVVEEETREDDKKIDVQKVKMRFSSAASSVAPVVPKKDSKLPSKPDGTNPGKFEQQKMMDEILAWLGTPYEYGGESRSGIDCSAFSREIFRSTAGVNLPRTTESQVSIGSAVPKENLAFGDLIFFNTTGQNPSHVGIYIGDEMFAHASVSFGVTLSSLYSSYYKKRFTEARRVIQ